jgi:large subunit ribosomal protein L9
MQVILLERVGRLGQMGDIVNVKNGYARNFLLPQKKALRATAENRTHFDQNRAQLEARNLAAKADAEAIAKRLDGKSFITIRTAGDTGQLYGSVSNRDISDLVTAGGYSIDRRMVNIDSPIKTLGMHSASVQLHPEVTAKVTVNVARSEEEAEKQARGENVSVVKSEGVELETFQGDGGFDQDDDIPGMGEQPR